MPEGKEGKVMMVGKSVCGLVLAVSPSRTLKPLGCGRELGGSLHLARRVTDVQTRRGWGWVERERLMP